MAIIGLSGYISSGKSTVANMIQYLTTPEKHRSWDMVTNRGDYLGLTPWKQRAFAYKLKQMVSLLTGIPVEDLEKQEVKSRQLGPEWSIYWFKHKTTGVYTMVPFDTKDIEGFKRRYAHIGADNLHCDPITVRDLLQKLGTDAVRDKVHPNAWVNALMADYQPLNTGGSIGSNTKINGIDYPELDFDTRSYPNWIISDCRFENEARAIKDKGGVIWRINRPTPMYIGERKLSEDKILRHSSETSLDNWPFDRTIENDGGLEELLSKVLVALQEGGLI